MQSKQLSHADTLPQETKCALYQVIKATPLRTSLFSPHQLDSQLTSHRKQESSSANQVPKVQSKSNRNKQGSAKPKKTKSTQRSFPSNTQKENAFVTGKVNDCPTKPLVDSGACISVINFEFIKKVLQKMTPNKR